MEDAQYQQAGQRLAGWTRTLVISHDRPDGDALGAIGAAGRVIESQGRQAAACTYGPVPPRYQFIETACGVSLWQPEQSAPLDDRFDGILILDTCSWNQMEPIAAALKSCRLPKVIIDHHATRDDLTGQDSDDLYLIDATSASACGMVHELCRVMGWALDEAARDALFAGMATDTGWFRFSNTDARTLAAAADLVQQGVRPDVLYARLFETHRPARLHLKREMLDTLQFHADGKLALMWLTRPMYLLSDATAADAEELVNEPLNVGSVIVSVLLSESEGGRIRVNLRSRAPEVAGRDIDVAEIARRWGGGGHRRAAGARIEGKLDEVRDLVRQAALDALSRRE
ncbi:MAG: phosphoesterase [Phycisphaerae bacterium]